MTLIIILSIIALIFFIAASIYISEIAYYGGWSRPCIHEHQVPKKPRYKIYFCITVFILLICSSTIIRLSWPTVQIELMITAPIVLFGFIFLVLHSKFIPKETKELKNEIPSKK